jgi:myo-inositol 2-dehydrogenase/D-chiro-inositol 1-dehydrogenase
MVGFNRRFDPHFAALKQRLDAGRDRRAGTADHHQPRSVAAAARLCRNSGGLFRDMMIHDLDMARFLLGEEPVEVTAAASCLVDPAIGAAGDVDTAW